VLARSSRGEADGERRWGPHPDTLSAAVVLAGSELEQVGDVDAEYSADTNAGVGRPDDPWACRSPIGRTMHRSGAPSAERSSVTRTADLR
jgi:hypothetical protein